MELREATGMTARVALSEEGHPVFIERVDGPGGIRFHTPLGWDVNDSEPVARACVALLSDWFPMTTGEIVHVDGGYHAVGA